MDIKQIGVVNLASRRIDYLAEQQRVVARNIANADTPKFQALEMRPFSEVLSSTLDASEPVRTNEKHLSGVGRGKSHGVVLNHTAPTSPNGNNVVLDEQMISASEAQANHALATSIYKKATSLIALSVK